MIMLVYCWLMMLDVGVFELVLILTDNAMLWFLVKFCSDNMNLAAVCLNLALFRKSHAYALLMENFKPAC